MTPTRITIHCSDSPNGKLVTTAEIRKWHLARGFHDIGYHFVIYPDGALGKGRRVDEMGAHVLGDNEGNLGICLDGRDRFTREQFAALRTLLQDLFSRFDILPAELHCHYEFPSAKAQGKSCPNMKIEDLSRWYFEQDESAIDKYILEEEHA